MKIDGSSVRVQTEQTANAARISLDDVSFIRLKEVLRLVQVSRSTIWRLMRANQFPRPFKLTPTGSATAFRRSEIAAWMQERQRS